ncbi:hypothetical protein BC829DRAFT_395014, partial [Chytridium lagenaria]
GKNASNGTRTRKRSESFSTASPTMAARRIAATAGSFHNTQNASTGLTRRSLEDLSSASVNSRDEDVKVESVHISKEDGLSGDEHEPSSLGTIKSRMTDSAQSDVVAVTEQYSNTTADGERQAENAPKSLQDSGLAEEIPRSISKPNEGIRGAAMLIQSYTMQSDQKSAGQSSYGFTMNDIDKIISEVAAKAASTTNTCFQNQASINNRRPSLSFPNAAHAATNKTESLHQVAGQRPGHRSSRFILMFHCTRLRRGRMLWMGSSWRKGLDRRRDGWEEKGEEQKTEKHEKGIVSTHFGGSGPGDYGVLSRRRRSFGRLRKGTEAAAEDPVAL